MIFSPALFAPPNCFPCFRPHLENLNLILNLPVGIHLAYFSLKMAQEEPFGRTSSGLVTRDYFQPILMGFSGKISAGRYDPNRTIPLPEDWSVGGVTDQLTPTLGKPADFRFRLAYGYISSIKATDSLDTGSPFCAQVILRLPFRYGASIDEIGDRWLYCRANAFASTAFLPRPAQAVRVGMPVCGVLTKSFETYQTAQLAGRPPTAAHDWKLLSPNTFPPNGIELTLRDIYRSHDLPFLRA